MSEYRPLNQDTHPDMNREPGIVLVPGSAYVRELAKFEQFHSKFTIGTEPGRPWVYRPFPKMLYRAQHYNGKPCCMAAPPDPSEYSDPAEADRATEAAARFTEKCQRIVNDESEYQRAMEDGWREGPAEAVAYLEDRDREVANITAHRNYEDRNMSDLARREAEEVIAAAGGEHQPEISGRKVAEAREGRRRVAR